MKIVNKKEFMELKTPIVFSHYSPCQIEGLYVCVDNSSMKNDFVQASLIDDVVPIGDEPESWSSGDVFDLLYDAEKNKTPFKLDLEFNGREGLYDDNKLYAVYDDEDITRLTDKLLEISNKKETAQKCEIIDIDNGDLIIATNDRKVYKLTNIKPVRVTNNNSKVVDIEFEAKCASSDKINETAKKLLNNLTKDINFSELRNIFFTHELWYGYGSKNVISEEIDINEDNWYTLFLNFIAYDKQTFVNIVIHYNNDVNINYFFTWYDSRPFEEAKKNGKDLTNEDYYELLKYLRNAGFKSDSDEYNKMKKVEECIDVIYLKPEE